MYKMNDLDLMTLPDNRAERNETENLGRVSSNSVTRSLRQVNLEIARSTSMTEALATRQVVERADFEWKGFK